LNVFAGDDKTGAGQGFFRWRQLGKNPHP